MIARAAGAGGKLEAAAPQLLGINKLEQGKDLIKLFSIPGKYQEESGVRGFHTGVIADNPEKWKDFGKYCTVDATCGLGLALEWGWVFTAFE